MTQPNPILPIHPSDHKCLCGTFIPGPIGCDTGGQDIATQPKVKPTPARGHGPRDTQAADRRAHRRSGRPAPYATQQAKIETLEDIAPHLDLLKDALIKLETRNNGIEDGSTVLDDETIVAEESASVTGPPAKLHKPARAPSTVTSKSWSANEVEAARSLLLSKGPVPSQVRKRGRNLNMNELYV